MPGPAYFVDENQLALGRALAACRSDVLHPGHPAIPAVPLGAKDPDWIPIVGAMGLVVITRDRFNKNAGERQALLDADLRVIRLVGKKEMTRWAKLQLLVARWDKMEAAVAAAGAGPWVIGLDGAGAFNLIVP